MGRHSFAPSDEQRRLVENLKAFGFTHDDIRKFIHAYGKPISCPTLEKHFRAELDTGALKANAQVAGGLLRQAIGGNLTATIFWLKTRCGWRETSDMNLKVESRHSPGDLPAPVPYAVMAERLKSLSEEELDTLIEKLLPQDDETGRG